MASGCTFTFKDPDRKRIPMGPGIYAAFVSINIAAASFHVTPTDHGFKYLHEFVPGARSLTTGATFHLLNNTRSGTTTANGTLFGEGFTDTDVLTGILYGRE